MQLPIPFFSQHTDVSDEQWKTKSCGVTCVSMVLDYLLPGERELHMPDVMIAEGLAIGGYTGEHGWHHESLVRLLRNHGVVAYRQEFITNTEVHQQKLIAAGITKLQQTITQTQLPVIVSVEANFDENKTSHLIVITGVDDDGFFYHDPDAKNGNKEHRHVSLDRFLQYWRKMAIFIEN